MTENRLPRSSTRNAVATRDRGAVLALLVCDSHGVDLFSGQLRHAMPVLHDHINHVVLCGSEKQVVGVDAKGGVAAVADHQPIGDRAEVQLPGEFVDTSCAALITTLADQPAPVQVYGSGPQPARAGLVHAVPETCFGRPANAGATAKQPVTFCHHRRAAIEHLAARLAGAFNAHVFTGLRRVTRLVAAGAAAIDSTVTKGDELLPTNGTGTLRVHDDLLSRCVMPRAA